MAGISGASLETLTVDIVARRRGRQRSVRVLDDVSLHVPAGQVTALIGESGCGKSMVAAALSGLLPPGAQVSGKVRIGDRSLTVRDPEWAAVRGRVVGLVPQSASTSFTPVRTIGDQLTEVVAVLRGSRGVGDLCAAAGYPRWALDRYPHEISGGMAQRAAIAAALAGDPSILVADEPTSALDPELAAGIWDLLGAAAAAGTAVLVITHDLDALLAADSCHSIAVMRAGVVVAQADPVDIAASREPYLADFFEQVI